MKNVKKELAIGAGAILILILVVMLVVHTAVALDNTIKCQSLSGVKDETGANLTKGDFIQIICTGANGSIDIPPASNGDPTGDDWLVNTTYAGCGYPFEPNSGKFGASIDPSNLSIGNIIYCRAWNHPTAGTYYGDSGTYTVTGAESEEHNFGTWATNNGPVPPIPELPTIILLCIGLLVLAGYVFRKQKRF